MAGVRADGDLCGDSRVERSNMTDGLDGLAAGTSAIIGVALGILAICHPTLSSPRS